MKETFFVTCTMDDIFHVELLVMQGTLREIMPKLHTLSQHSGCVCRVFALAKALVKPDHDPYFRTLQETGMLCQEVAHVNRDFLFDSWKQAFRNAFDQLPEPQLEVELVNLDLRIQQELNALRIRKGLTETATSAVGIMSSKAEGEPEHICISCSIGLADNWQPNRCAACIAASDLEAERKEKTS